MIFDEPTSGLDPRQIIEIRELIKELGKEHTIILSTHILPEASMTCERLIVINEGRIAGDVKLAEGRPISIATGAGDEPELGDGKTLYLEVSGQVEEVTTALESVPSVDRVESRETSESDNPIFDVSYNAETDVRAEIAATIVRNGWSLLEMRSIEMTLEEVFLRLTTGTGDEANRLSDDVDVSENNQNQNGTSGHRRLDVVKYSLLVNRRAGQIKGPTEDERKCGRLLMTTILMTGLIAPATVRRVDEGRCPRNRNNRPKKRESTS